MLVHNKFAYTQERETSDSTFWKCSLFRRFKCKARAITKMLQNEEYVRISNRVHTHPPDEYKIYGHRAKFNVEAAKNTEEEVFENEVYIIG
jgi:hypothetical protein